ncbi:unnamed protein product [Mytilus edulis]|uniref:DZIP3-like HEPN domain-containing protein n=1 Tax=Mytilus edulis TaxID=6550 RepID=A0A8S3S3A3_MYTED|nr:unnamed protein product [Mytilus edulis]
MTTDLITKLFMSSGIIPTVNSLNTPKLLMTKHVRHHNHKHILVHQLHQSTKCCECKTGDIKQISRLTPVQFDLLFETDERREINGHKRTKGPEIIQICLCSISAKRTTTVDLMDISLMSAVLNSCCPPGSISGNPKWIKDIKETRNLIAHSPSDKISKSEYVQQFTLIEKISIEDSRCNRSCISKNDKRKHI